MWTICPLYYTTVKFVPNIIAETSTKKKEHELHYTSEWNNE